MAANLRPHVAALLLTAALAGQQEQPAPQDPFTAGQEKAMQALGVVAYAPFKWADDFGTADIERVLGEGRIAWLETAHFRFGSTLHSIGIPDDVQAKKELFDECARLGKKSSKVPKRPRKLDPWYRLHLYAQRAEEIYADMAAMVGAADGKLPSGPFLGLPDKYVVLLLEKKSDLSRYCERFCGRQTDVSMRHLHEKSRQEAVMLTAEADTPHDDPALHSQFRYLIAGALLDGLDGRTSSTPEWLRLGLSHHYERQVTTNMITVKKNDDESVDQQSQHLWREKMCARAQHEQLLLPFAKLAVDADLGYYANVQAWARVEHLRALGAEKLGAFLMACKKNPSFDHQHAALQEVFDFDGETWDRTWRDWVLKTFK